MRDLAVAGYDGRFVKPQVRQENDDDRCPGWPLRVEWAGVDQTEQDS